MADDCRLYQYTREHEGYSTRVYTGTHNGTLELALKCTKEAIRDTHPKETRQRFPILPMDGSPSQECRQQKTKDRPLGSCTGSLTN